MFGPRGLSPLGVSRGLGAASARSPVAFIEWGFYVVRVLRRAAIAVAAVALLAQAVPTASATPVAPVAQAGPAAAVEPAGPAGPVAAKHRRPTEVPANYTLRSRYNGDIDPFRGWQIEWVTPTLISPNSNTSGAIGQWYWNLEAGIYYFNNNWNVYWYSDDDGTTGDNFTDCIPNWNDAGGGWCPSLVASPGQHIVFTYEYCTASSNAFNANGTYNCVWVNMNDGVGKRFLAKESRFDASGQPRTKEMYAHDVESFPSPGSPDELRINCSSPTKMVSQKVRNGNASFTNLTTRNWLFEVQSTDNVFYDFQNINLTGSAPNWQSCTPTSAPICSPPNAYWDLRIPYATNQVVAWNRKKYKAKRSTTNEIPGVVTAAWQDLGSC